MTENVAVHICYRKKPDFFFHTEVKAHCSVQNSVYTGMTTLDVKNHILSFRTVYETSKRIRDLR